MNERKLGKNNVKKKKPKERVDKNERTSSDTEKEDRNERSVGRDLVVGSAYFMTWKIEVLAV